MPWFMGYSLYCEIASCGLCLFVDLEIRMLVFEGRNCEFTLDCGGFLWMRLCRCDL